MAAFCAHAEIADTDGKFSAAGTLAAASVARMQYASFSLLATTAAVLAAPGAVAGDSTCAAGRESYAPSAFFGFACVDVDCRGHKAGFAWADRHGDDAVRGCDGIAEPTLIEGCRAYALEVVTVELAGFEWARDNEIADPCRCRGAGPRFEAGCTAYVSGFAR
jgi:hypothetical protein